MLCGEYDPGRAHGVVTWRVYDGLPVVEIVNNWACGSFADSYRSPAITARLRSVLHAVQPEVIHAHSLLNLSFDLPAVAEDMGIPVVGTLHDYTLACASGGQRVHRAAAHRCEVIDTTRCARCFRESPFFSQIAFGKVAPPSRTAGQLREIASRAIRRFPMAGQALLRTAQHASTFPVTAADIEARLAYARHAFSRVSCWIAPSASIAREFESLGFDASRIRISDYGFRPMPRAARRPVSSPLRVGFVGTLVWHKGVHVLLDAASGLPRDRYTLTLFGDPDVFPPYTADLTRQSAGLPVRFAGPFRREDASAAFAQIDVLVVPSIWLENSPLVIHEAYMAGVPVVGARIGGIVDLVHDGTTGLLYDPDSPTELRAVLQRLIDAPSDLDRLAAALPAVKSIEDDAAEIERLYEAVIANSGRERQPS